VIRIRTSTEANSATVRVFSRDYGGLAKIRARVIIGGSTVIEAQATGSERTGPEGRYLLIPKDDDFNQLPDAKWIDAENKEVITSGLTVVDLDQFPTNESGELGDLLSAYEEYRGFIVRGSHRRTNPNFKDLFIVSDQLTQNIGYANNLLLPKHRVFANEVDANHNINFNFQNSGYGGNIPEHPDDSFNQRALFVVDGLTPAKAQQSGVDITGVKPEAFGMGDPATAFGPPRNSKQLLIFTENIKRASPPTNDPAMNDSVDDPAIRMVIAHEVGHQIGMPDIQNNPGVEPSVMMTYLAENYTNCAQYPSPPFLPDCMSDPKYPPWTDIPFDYKPRDLIKIRLK
jgi:hypothetical protein